jgi:hypothetical protein
MTTKPYEAKFAVGTRVRIKDRSELERFKQTWKYHHPLSEKQLDYGGVTAAVKEVSFYHGGDALYELDGVPGMWHEECLSAP